MKTPCDRCQTKEEDIQLSSCCTGHIDLSTFGSKEQGCFDDRFYCKKCLTPEGFCLDCAKVLPKELQERIGKYLDTGDSRFKNS